MCDLESSLGKKPFICVLNRLENRRFSNKIVCIAVIHAVKANGRHLYPSAFIPSNQAADGSCQADSKLQQWSRVWLMVIGTSSAGSTGGIFLSGKEDEIILFLAAGGVLEHLISCTGTSKLAPGKWVPQASGCPGLMQLSAGLCSSGSTQNTGCGCEVTEQLEVTHQPCFLSSFLIFSTQVAVLSY